MHQAQEVRVNADYKQKSISSHLLSPFLTSLLSPPREEPN